MKLKIYLLTLILALFSLSGTAHAGGISAEPVPLQEQAKLQEAQPQKTPADHIIRLTPNKTHIVRLAEDAGSVIVSNPRHASVLIDSPRVLIIIPRTPGATSFMVLDGNGRLIAERDVVVTAQEEQYVRIRRVCGDSATNCQANAVYYCPDGCYAIATEGLSSAGDTTQSETINDDSTQNADGGNGSGDGDGTDADSPVLQEEGPAQ